MKISKVSTHFRFLIQILFVCTGFLCGIFSNIQAQTDALPFAEIDLNNLEDFQSATENWQLAGGVFMDTYRDHHVQPLEGTGVLINTAEGEQPQDIYTSWEHGDRTWLLIS
ncbi:MAG: hypothetical protein U5K69_08570 [Balneolaceae bacterium]|nr:hypothetical protein [Balneolaceae bacterium]